jgi:hypothetical protein
LFFSKNFQYRVIFLIKLVTKPPNNDKMPMARNGLASIDCGVCGLGVGAHDWQKIRFVLIFERFSHFLMECVV